MFASQDIFFIYCDANYNNVNNVKLMLITQIFKFYCKNSFLLINIINHFSKKPVHIINYLNNHVLWYIIHAFKYVHFYFLC